MKSREEWRAEQERLLAVYDEARAQLMRIPGVVEVGIAVRERGGQHVEEAVFRVSVVQKLPLDRVPPDQRIPPRILGFPTDVIVHRQQIPSIGFDDEDDWKNYGNKVGGSRIGSEDGGGTGTLGCFCRLNSDNSVVFLSNHHVLFSGSAKATSGVGQPEHKTSCCCTCNEIGKVLDGEAGALDCAMAKLNAGVAFYSKVRTIKKADGTVEQNGFISGSGAAVLNEEVWKTGARTGLTRGTLTKITPDLEMTPKAPFPRANFYGDSGSVCVSLATGNVVGLIKSMDSATNTLAYATPIAAVLARLNITVIPTDPALEYNVFDTEEAAPLVPAESPFLALVERLRGSANGREVLRLFELHGDECLELVNRRRRFTVAWQRNSGPAWLAAAGRSAREPAYRLPAELGGIARGEALRDIVRALTAEASELLRHDLQQHAPVWLEAVDGCDTVDELIAATEGVLVPA